MRSKLPWHPTRLLCVCGCRRPSITRKARCERSLDGSASASRLSFDCSSGDVTLAPWLPSLTAVDRAPP